VDDDGDIDVLSASYDDNIIAWYENDGNEDFTTHIITTGTNGALSVYAADVDGDGDMDVLSASRLDNRIAWYENDGNENFTSHTITTNANGAASVYAVDVDGDGDIDVLSASINDNKIALYENDGNENFTTHTITTGANGAVSVYAVDVDGDGDIDVLSAPAYDNKIAWYENDGNENFTIHTITTEADEAYSVYAVDVDSDGDIDVLSASLGDDKIAWYENDGNENFTTYTITTDVISARSVYAVDVDGDGDIDVLSASINDNKIAWYENLGVPGNNLVAYYPFNGNANDESGNEHHGSIISDPSFIQDRHGNPNSALSFDGIDDWIEVNSSSLFPSDAITMCYWVNRDGNDITSLQNYISKEHSFQSYNQDYSGGENRFASGYWLGSPGVWKNYYTNYEVTNLNEWIFYAFSYDNNTQTAKSYVNGVLDDTVVETDPNYYLRSSGHKMYIGRNGSANVYHIQGFLDDIRIYDRALTGEEIFQLYDLTPVGNQVTVTSPNGGEVWGMDTDKFITWSSIDIIDVKIEFSFNNGASWELVDESVPSTGIYSWNIPAVHTIQGLIKISDVTDEDVFDISDGVFTIEPVTGMEDEDNKLIPDNYSLAQNHPNPFNATTQIKYGLPDAGPVTIRVYDVLGNEVAILVNDRMEDIYHMRVNDFIDTKKMILMK
jgi:hypothetical protein